LAVLTTDSEFNEVKSRRRRSCSVRDTSAVTKALTNSQWPNNVAQQRTPAW